MARTLTVPTTHAEWVDAMAELRSAERRMTHHRNGRATRNTLADWVAATAYADDQASGDWDGVGPDYWDAVDRSARRFR